MKRLVLTYTLLLALFVSCVQSGKDVQCNEEAATVTVAIDTMDLANPYILYDKLTDLYYMTGDGGAMWRSKDMRVWEGPYEVLAPAAESWIGASSVVTSPEIHRYKDRYYYMATFTDRAAVMDTVGGKNICRTSCEIFVSDNLMGPYTHIAQDAPLLNSSHATQHPTFCTDELNVGYMIYNHSGEQNGDATVQIIRLGRNFDVQVGEPYIMFRASQNSWSRATNSNGPSPLMKAPFLFNTYTGGLGVLFTTYVGNEQCIGVAYSQTGHLDGPWLIEPVPLLDGNVGGAMLFNDYDGKLLMACHKDTVIGGTRKSLPLLIRVDSQFDKLKLNGHYKF